ncbi:dnaJ homolog subfamily B member 2 isoform X2 [Antennarius striatus]
MHDTGFSSSDFPSDFPGFTFRSPMDVFNEFFFSQIPINNLLGNFTSSESSSSHMGPSGFFSFPSGIADFTSFSSSFGGLDGMNSISGGSNKFTSVSTSTRIVNGKRTVTKKTKENGQERTEIEEDGVLKKVLINGVEDDLALALELSQRESQPHQMPLESDAFGVHCTGMNQSFNFFNPNAERSSDSSDEDDEDLQAALALSLSEMDAQQRTAVTDFLTGAGVGVRAKSDKSGGRKGRDVETTNMSATDSGKLVAGRKVEERQFKGESGPGGGGERVEPGFSPESSTTSSCTKKKNKCGCVVG